MTHTYSQSLIISSNSSKILNSSFSSLFKICLIDANFEILFKIWGSRDKLFTDGSCSLNSFFNKQNKTIKSNFLIEGNTIQKKVWRELTKIKIGKTKSYGEIAKKFKLSPRHVGKICGQNKIPLAIPCHRVIRSDGTIGGFSASRGIILKKKLLNFENSWK